MTSLTELLDAAVKEHSGRVGIKSLVDNSEYTYLEIGDISRRVSDVLLSEGLEKGEKVAIISDNNPWFIFADYGVLYAGGVSVPIDETLPETILRKYLADSSPKIMLVQEKYYGKVKRAAPTDVKIIKIQDPNPKNFEKNLFRNW